MPQGAAPPFVALPLTLARTALALALHQRPQQNLQLLGGRLAGFDLHGQRAPLRAQRLQQMFTHHQQPLRPTHAYVWRGVTISRSLQSE